MVWLPEGEKMSKMFLFVLTECTSVTDGQTPHDAANAALHSIARQKSTAQDRSKY